MHTLNGLLENAIKAYEVYLTKNGKSELTVKNYVGDVQQFRRYYAGTLPEDAEVTLAGATEIAQEYVRQLKRDVEVKTTTTNRKIVSLRQFFHFCANNSVLGLIVTTDPMDTVGVTKFQDGGTHAVKWLSRDDVNSILDAIPNIPKTNNITIARNRAIILVLVNCGLRVGELTELRIGDVDFENGVLNIRHGKGDKFRQVPITRSTLEAVSNWIIMRTRNTGLPERIKGTKYLFTSERADKLSERGVQHLTQVLSKVSGVEFSPHTLRHTYCKNIADSTGQLEIVADLAGHANINTTRIYTTPSMKELTKVIEDIEFE